MFHLASFLSAVAALTYQVCWLRHWSLVQGSDTYAQATVFAVLMLGFAIGSRVAGPLAERSQRPLFAYGLAELGIAVTALLAVWGVSASESISAWIYTNFSGQPMVLTLFRTVLGFVVLILPTFLMGATLPLLVRAASERSGRLDHSLASLYAANTLGAAAGAALAGYFLVATVGVTRTLFVAVGANCVVALWALFRYRVVGRTEALERIVMTVPADRQRPAQDRVFALVLALSGAALLTYELAWTRVVALTIGGSIYSYTTVLVTVLLGLGIGNAIASWRVRQGPVGVTTISYAFLGLGMTGVVSFFLAGHLPLYLMGLRPLIGETLFATQVYGALLCFLLYLGPTIFSGMVLPLVCATLAQRGHGVTRSFAAPYAINSAGAVIGSLVAGLFAIQWLGLEGLIRWTTVAMLLCGIVLLIARNPEWRTGTLVPALGLVAVVVAMPGWSPQVMASGPYQYGVSYLSRYVEAATDEDHQTLRQLLEENKTLFHRDGSNSTVSVFEHPGGHRSIKVNGKADAGTASDMRTQILLGVLPVLAAPEAQDVCVIGLGSGVTVAAALHSGAESIDCVEIESHMLAAAEHFDDVNLSVLESPALELIRGDARNHLTLTEESYDIIISEPSNPWIAGVSSLFTREFYQSCRERMRPGGIFGQWVQLYSLDERDFLLILRTLESEFPYLGLYLLTPGDSLILASESPIRFHAPQLEALAAQPTPEPWLEHVELTEPYALLERSFVLDELGIRGYLYGWDHVSHDDHPVLEYRAPRALRRNDWRKFCNSFYRSWLAGREPFAVSKDSWESEPISLRGEQMRVARRLRDAGNPDGARRKLEALLEVFPSDMEIESRLREVAGNAPGG